MKKLLIKQNYQEENNVKLLNYRSFLELEASNEAFMMIFCLILNIFIVIFYYLEAVYNNPW
jgi:hypothetical protein